MIQSELPELVICVAVTLIADHDQIQHLIVVRSLDRAQNTSELASVNRVNPGVALKHHLRTRACVGGVTCIFSVLGSRTCLCWWGARSQHGQETGTVNSPYTSLACGSPSLRCWHSFSTVQVRKEGCPNTAASQDLSAENQAPDHTPDCSPALYVVPRSEHSTQSMAAATHRKRTVGWWLLPDWLLRHPAPQRGIHGNQGERHTFGENRMCYCDNRKTLSFRLVTRDTSLINEAQAHTNVTPPLPSLWSFLGHGKPLAFHRPLEATW